jgi:long-chain acyl-CoA synthetase
LPPCPPPPLPGEYIAVEKLEASYKKNLDVEQVWVYGNSFKSCLLAVVVPTVAAAEKWAAANGVKGTYAEICANEAYSAALLKDLQATGAWRVAACLAAWLSGCLAG